MSEPPWFIAPAEAWGEHEIVLDEDESHHGLDVLRISVAADVVVTDGRGGVAHGVVRRVEGGRVLVEVLNRELRRPPRPEVVVYQGAAKGAKNDLVVERLAELGVAATFVFSSERTVVRWDESKRERTAARWLAIARGAAKQSRNPFLMQTHPLLSWPQLIAGVKTEPSTIALWEEASLPLRRVLPEQTDRIALVVGPEGGLTRAEADSLAAAGAALTSLGERILRTENAAVVGTAALSYHYGLIG